MITNNHGKQEWEGADGVEARREGVNGRGLTGGRVQGKLMAN